MQMKIASALLILASANGFTAKPSQTRGTKAFSSLKMVANPQEVEDWSPESWKNFPAKGQPNYQDGSEQDAAFKRIRDCSPLVFAGEVRSLHEQLARACQGQGFVLMGGDSAEGFGEFSVDNIRDTFRVILQMALVLTFGSAMPIIKMGRMIGQSANARSGPDGEQDEIGNALSMVDAYHQSSQTLNILRAFSTGGYADISRLHAWNLDFVEQTEEGSRYRKFATKVDESLRFMKAIGVDTGSDSFTKTNFFTVKECSLLPYEQALTREDSTTGRYYDCSSHMLWVGDETRELDGAHLEFCRGIGNPLGVRVSDKCTPDELIRIVDTMNPQNIPGRLTVIVQMGAEKLRKNLPGLIRAIQREGRSVLWVSDPLHGNTRKTDAGMNTRDFDSIRSELRAFFDIHDEMGSHPGGVHLDMTGEDVTECVGGMSGVTDQSLSDRYATYCDPRLNGAQAVELAFLISERLRVRTGLPAIE